MKKLMSIFFVLFFFSTSLTALEESDRIYLNEEDIFLDQGKMYLLIEDGCFEVHVLMSDHEGIYISPEELKWPYTPFTCRECGTLNAPGALRCKKCGTRRPD